VKEVVRDTPRLNLCLAAAYIFLRGVRDGLTMGALFFRPENDGGFQESSAEMMLTFFSAGVCPMTLARFGDMFVLQSTRYSSSGTSSETAREG